MGYSSFSCCVFILHSSSNLPPPFPAEGRHAQHDTCVEPEHQDYSICGTGTRMSACIYSYSHLRIDYFYLYNSKLFYDYFLPLLRDSPHTQLETSVYTALRTPMNASMEPAWLVPTLRAPKLYCLSHYTKVLYSLLLAPVTHIILSGV